MLIENVPSWVVNASVGVTLLAGIGAIAFIAAVVWLWTFDRLLVVFKIKRLFVDFILDGVDRRRKASAEASFKRRTGRTRSINRKDTPNA